MSNERYEPQSGMSKDSSGYYVRYADHIAQIAEARRIIEAYRKAEADNAEEGVLHFHDECFVDAKRKVDTRCATCKSADKFLEETKP
jgi:hypothetical protein